MAGNVVPFPYLNSHTTPIGQFYRLGDDGSRALADLFASGDFRPDRVVVDASRIDKQLELITALRKRSVEIVLDPKTAELAALGRFEGRVQQAPWAALTSGGVLGPDYFGHSPKADVIGAIARFAASRPIDAVLAPTHWLGDPNFPKWLEVDFGSCIRLREALDREGGKHIAIDYLLIAPHTFLQSTEGRNQIVQRLRDAPFDSLWVRASGLKNNAAPLTTRWHIEALCGLHEIERPIIADYLGGMTGAAMLAFGAASAIAHGIAKLEGFDASDWRFNTPRRVEGESLHKSQTRISLVDMNRSLTVKELQWLANARGARKHIACGDRECCPNGFEDMLRYPRRHFVRQSRKLVDALMRVPDLKRAEHFLDHQLTEIERRARFVTKLKPDSNAFPEAADNIKKLGKRLFNHAENIEKVHSALENFR
ncbi:hypothetical protein [Kumtagia ephedrae]|uniref:hypothetical protein n=1 Tax=Kumtagia ephedrae TaxID=2116701 RepID=UPI0010572889|nr:hypothetical protein [Mesorhizobium ephedrae]